MNDFAWFSKEGPAITAKDLAEKIRNGGKWKVGMPVVLNSCSTGSPRGTFGRELARHLSTDVYAPTDWVWFNRNGVEGVYANRGTSRDPIMDTSKPGRWVKF